MVAGCFVKGCKSESYAGCGISFHQFPKNEEMRTKWLEALGCPNKQVSKFAAVCSLHFKTEDYRATCLPRLKDDAIPSIETRSLYGIESDATKAFLAAANATVVEDTDLDSIATQSDMDDEASTGGTTLDDRSWNEALDSAEAVEMDIKEEEDPASPDPLSTQPAARVTRSRQLVSLALKNTKPIKVVTTNVGTQTTKTDNSVLTRKEQNLLIQLKWKRRKIFKLTSANARLKEKVKTLQDILAKVCAKSRYFKKNK